VPLVVDLHQLMPGNCSPVCSIELRNAGRIRPYRNVVNQEILDSVDRFPLVERVPEILAGAKKVAGAGYLHLNPPCHSMQSKNRQTHNTL
jgi:hypothetical protein